MSDVEATYNNLRQRLGTIPEHILLRWRGTPTPTWDNFSRYVYQSPSFEHVVEVARSKARDRALDEEAFVSYAVVKYFNFLTSRLVETMFLRHPHAVAEPACHKTKDVRLFGQPFDVKLTFLPKARRIPVFREDLWDPRSLMRVYLQEQGWLRFSDAPRLLVVLADLDSGNNEMTRWRLKRELTRLETLVRHYMELPQPRLFPEIPFRYEGREHGTLCDILLLVKDQGHFQDIVYRWNAQGMPAAVWHHESLPATGAPTCGHDVPRTARKVQSA